MTARSDVSFHEFCQATGIDEDDVLAHTAHNAFLDETSSPSEFSEWWHHSQARFI